MSFFLFFSLIFVSLKEQMARVTYEWVEDPPLRATYPSARGKWESSGTEGSSNIRESIKSSRRQKVFQNATKPLVSFAGHFVLHAPRNKVQKANLNPSPPDLRHHNTGTATKPALRLPCRLNVWVDVWTSASTWPRHLASLTELHENISQRCHDFALFYCVWPWT
jgi:hypothetical protein